MEVQVYEYYDGYEFEHDEKRKVQYIDLGRNPLYPRIHVICYIELPYVCHIHSLTHDRAWNIKLISFIEAFKHLKAAYQSLHREFNNKDPVEFLMRKIENTLINKERIDAERALAPGQSVSSSISYLGHIHIHCRHGESYVDKLV
jgi:hypothetical protein